jgi:hypothetical protein
MAQVEEERRNDEPKREYREDGENFVDVRDDEFARIGM